MNINIKVFSLVFSLFISTNLLSQSGCKVLIKELQGSYVGKCKKGLANGQGTATGIDTYSGNWKKGLPDGDGKYTWASGDTYNGEWHKGMKNGYGIYQFKYKDKDTVITGVWQNDIYQGKQRKSPKIIQQYNIDKYQIHNVNAYENRVLFDFWQNGARNSSINNLNLIATSGTEARSGQLIGFDNIIFPTTITVRYTSYNKLKTTQFNAVFQITIYEAGDYEIKLFN